MCGQRALCEAFGQALRQGAAIEGGLLSCEDGPPVDDMVAGKLELIEVAPQDVAPIDQAISQALQLVCVAVGGVRAVSLVAEGVPGLVQGGKGFGPDEVALLAAALPFKTGGVEEVLHTQLRRRMNHANRILRNIVILKPCNEAS